MSVGSELDVDLQDLARVFTHSDGADLLHAYPGSDAWVDNAGDVLAQMLKMGWLPPTYTEHVKAKVKQAWEAVEDDESFRALEDAAGVLNVELVDPMADPLNSMTLGKVA